MAAMPPIEVETVNISTSRSMPVSNGSKRSSLTRREALEVKLKKTQLAARERAEDEKEGLKMAQDIRSGKVAARAVVVQREAPQAPRKEALEIQLRSTSKERLRQTEREEASPSQTVEGLAKRNELKRVNSELRQKAGAMRDPRVSMRRRASSLMAMGGIKPSLMKAAKARREGSGEDEASDDFVGFVSVAHSQMKQALADQQAELARLEAEMEEKRKEAQKAERAEMLNRHLGAMRAAQAAKDQKAMEALRAEQAAERRKRDEMDRAREERLLDEVFDEIIETEATYLNDLRFVSSRFLMPMRGMLTPQQHNSIFANIDTLLPLHEKLHGDLQPAERPKSASDGEGGDGGAAASTPSMHWEERGLIIAQAFLKLAPFFKMYAVYSAQYALVPEALEAARKDAAIDAFLNKAASRQPAADPAADPAAASANAAPRRASGGGELARLEEEGEGEGDGERSSSAAPAAAAPGTAPAAEDAEPTPAADDGGAAAPSAPDAAYEVAAQREAALEQLLFRPVQRMCIYPLLFKQAVNQRLKIERWDEEIGGGSGGGTRGEALRAKLEEVFAVIGQTLGTVNEDVRGKEARSRTLHVLSELVNGGVELIQAGRVLKHEVTVQVCDLGRSGGCLGCFGGGGGGGGRPHAWYIFSDGVLIVRGREPICGFVNPNDVQITPTKKPGAFFAEVTSDDGLSFTLDCILEAGDSARDALLAKLSETRVATNQAVERAKKAQGKERESSFTVSLSLPANFSPK